MACRADYVYVLLSLWAAARATHLLQVTLADLGPRSVRFLRRLGSVGRYKQRFTASRMRLVRL